MLNGSDSIDQELNSLLPYGESIRPLLTASSLSEFDLRYLLQKRGVFSKVSPRHYTVPLLASIILSPREFEILKNRQHQKESNIKTSTAQAEWNGGNQTIVDVVGDQMDPIVKSLAIEDSPYKISQFNVKNVTSNKIVVEGEIKRNDWTKDVFSITTYHNWKLTIEKEPTSNVIEYKAETTAPETKGLVSKLQNAVHKFFQNSKVISAEKQIQKILATHFKKHEFRFEYLFSFTQKKYDALKFKRIVNIETGIDNLQSFPDNFKWLKGNISGLSLQALQDKKLEETDIIEIGKLGILIFGDIDAEFTFKYAEAQGRCVIRYGFPNYFEKKTQVELETKILKLDLANDCAHVSKEGVKRHLLSDFQKSKHKTFEEFKASNKVDTAPRGLDNQYSLFNNQ